MNSFEFFCLIYFMLDHCWEETKDEKLTCSLSDMNPYLWMTEDSADPAVYANFQDFMQGKTLGDDNGFQLAKDFLKSLKDSSELYAGLDAYLDEYSQEEWDDAMRQLLSQPHKGQSEC